MAALACQDRGCRLSGHAHVAVALLLFLLHPVMQDGARAVPGGGSRCAPGDNAAGPSTPAVLPPAAESSSQGSSSQMLAPYSVSLDRGRYTQIGPARWRMQAGSTVSSFIGANGPPSVTGYNWNKVRSHVDTVLVTLATVEPPRGATGKLATSRHDVADKLWLTAHGLARAAKPSQCNTRVYLLELACTCARRRQPNLAWHTLRA